MKYSSEHTTQTKSKISTPITTVHVPDCSLLLALHQHYCQLISKVFLKKLPISSNLFVFSVKLMVLVVSNHAKINETLRNIVLSRMY